MTCRTCDDPKCERDILVGDSKKCYSCSPPAWKHLDQFSRDKGKVDGRQTRCKMCVSAYDKTRTLEHGRNKAAERSNERRQRNAVSKKTRPN